MTTPAGKKYRDEHREEAKVYKKKYYQEHREELKVYHNKYRKEHWEKIRENKKRWGDEHREELKENKKEWYKEHREKTKARAKKWRKEHTDQRRVIQWRNREKHQGRIRTSHWKTIGVDMTHWSYDDYLKMLKNQNGKCCGCGRGLVASTSQVVGAFRVAYVDHNHITGMVRGLLCGNCNFAIGQAGDNPDILRKLADYLDGK